MRSERFGLGMQVTSEQGLGGDNKSWGFYSV